MSKTTAQTIPVEARLDELTRKIDALRDVAASAVEREDAERRFQVRGEAAAPMTTRQVAIVLNCSHDDGSPSVEAVNQLVQRKLLKRRFGRFGFHPDDVREFLETRRNKPRERIDDFLTKRRAPLSEVLNGIREAHT